MHRYPDGNGCIYQSNEQIPVLKFFVNVVLIAIHQKRKLKPPSICTQAYNHVIVVIIYRYITRWHASRLQSKALVLCFYY